MFVPGLNATAWARKAVPADGLSAMRRIWCSLVLALFLNWFVLTFIRPPGPVRASWFPYLLTVYGICALAIAMRPWGRGVATNVGMLAARYRTVFFIVVGLSESIAILGFVGTFIMRTIWIYPLGLALALLGMWWVAPTRGHLERDEKRLTPSGGSMPLVEALMTAESPRR
jgi:hypothetical protein